MGFYPLKEKNLRLERGFLIKWPLGGFKFIVLKGYLIFSLNLIKNFFICPGREGRPGPRRGGRGPFVHGTGDAATLGARFSCFQNWARRVPHWARGVKAVAGAERGPFFITPGRSGGRGAEKRGGQRGVSLTPDERGEKNEGGKTGGRSTARTPGGPAGERRSGR